ncbi:MAG: hypothetical protein AAFV85_25025 [Cyanobacteria bacterium J06634_6]
MSRPRTVETLFGSWPIGYGAGLVAALLLSVGNALPATAQAAVDVDDSGAMHRTAYFELNRAICNNDWHGAIGLTSVLIGQDTTTATNRQALLSLRRQLDPLRAEKTVLGRTQACDVTDPYMLAADPLAMAPELGPEPLGWDLAVAEAASYQYGTNQDVNQIATESVEMTLPVDMTTRPGLLNAMPIDLSRGLNVVSGHVGTGHQVYGFVAGMGDRINLNLEVTDVMTGTLYTSDDSQLFVFDREGRLIAFSDDEGEGGASNIDGMIVPKTDAYFAVVTSYNNDPIFDQENRLTGWHENGGGRFDYTLSVAGATPTQRLMR